jgi:LuxR family maltose regulon positive regulatory protein
MSARCWRRFPRQLPDRGLRLPLPDGRGSDGPSRPSPLVDPLSARELEILQLIADGLSNQEIAARLYLALDTVKGHNRRIFEKLQVQRRTEAVAKARALGLLPHQ